MSNIEFEDILALVPTIPVIRSYWLVRTHGGEYFDDFLRGDYIAVGYDDVKLETLQRVSNTPSQAVTALSAIVKDLYEDVNRTNYIASQLYKFHSEIKSGDMVMIPSHSSYHVYFGEVVDGITYEAVPSEGDEIDNCPFKKRKKVKWLKGVYREKLNPYLYKLLYSHHTITDADSYAQYIDQTVHSLFIKNNRAHLVLDVATQDAIKAKDLFSFGSTLFELVEAFGDQYGYDLDTDDILVRLNLQSPGKIELSGKQKSTLIMTGIIVLGLIGGGLKVEWGGFSFDLSTDGLFKRYLEFREQEHDMKIKDEIVKKHIEKFNVQNPYDLVNVLRQLSDNKPKESK